jgi:single-strand DNA-binding protein
MNHINYIFLEGCLVAEPTHRTISSNRPVVSFRLASSRSFKKADNTWGEDTTFVDIEAWDHAANHAIKWLHKGTRCAITGRLKQDTWQDPKTGQNRSKLLILADVITNTMHQQPTEQGRAYQPTPHQQQKQNAYQPTPESTDDIPF